LVEKSGALENEGIEMLGAGAEVNEGAAGILFIKLF
jgi:hypothetical protein